MGGGEEGTGWSTRFLKGPGARRMANMTTPATPPSRGELPWEGKAKGTGVGIAEPGGQSRKVRKTRIVTEQGCFSVFPEAGTGGLA